MTTPPPRTRLLAALAAGLGTTAYYATPDLIASRTARGWTKAAILGVIATAAVPDFLAVRDEMRRATATKAGALAGPEPQEVPDGPDGPAPVPTAAEVFESMGPRGKVAVVGAAAGALALTAGLTVAAERWMFRHGEARAAAGRRLPHTGPALAYGALATALWLIPPPSVAE